jgi:hypothetical protein
MATLYVEYTILCRICQESFIGGNGTRHAALIAGTETS